MVSLEISLCPHLAVEMRPPQPDYLNTLMFIDSRVRLFLNSHLTLCNLGAHWK